MRQGKKQAPKKPPPIFADTLGAAVTAVSLTSADAQEKRIRQVLAKQM